MLLNNNLRTVSRWIILNDYNKILLVKHKKWGKWVLPWWHIEKKESPHQWFIREIREEFQIEIEFLWNKLETEDPWISPLPLPIDCYTVEYNHHKFWPVKKIEYIFLWKYVSWEIVIQEEEIYTYNWFTKEEILSKEFNTYEKVIELIKIV